MPAAVAYDQRVAHGHRVAAFLHAVVVVVVAEAVPWAGAIDIYSSGIYRVFVRDGETEAYAQWKG